MLCPNFDGSLLILLPDGGLFGIAAAVRTESPVQVDLLPPAEDIVLDLRCYLPAEDSPHVSNQAIRFAQRPALYGLRHDQEGVNEPGRSRSWGPSCRHR